MSCQEELKAIISKNSYITIDQFMAIAINAYYRKQTAIGDDFITAPEISQMFGQIIAIWAVLSFEQQQLTNFNLVELGGGNSTLMVDFLNAARQISPAFFAAIKQIIIVEISPELMLLQQKRLEPFGINIIHLSTAHNLPHAPSIIIANEFLDALAIKQYQKKVTGWHEVVIKYSDNFYFSLLDEPIRTFAEHINAPLDAIFEIGTAGQELTKSLVAITSNNGGATLLIDYGYFQPPQMRRNYSSSLQAMKRHQFCDVLEELGQNDVTAHVDFYQLQQVAINSGATMAKVQTQQQFLQQFGINQHLYRLLARHANDQALCQTLIRQHDYLVNKMGHLFKMLSW